MLLTIEVEIKFSLGSGLNASGWNLKRPIPNPGARAASIRSIMESFWEGKVKKPDGVML